jgi:hypothetical protein
VGHQFALGQIRKIMIVALQRFAIMRVKLPVPIQASEEFLLLGVHTQNGQTPLRVVFAKFADVLELGVAQDRVHFADCL